ncbi:MAG: GNAT family N-acetyltransferase [Pseudomonadota bacterium]
MPPERLREEDVTFFAVRHEGRLAAVGALKSLTDKDGELKSMRASPAFRGKGAGRALLEHLIAEARARGLGWLVWKRAEPRSSPTRGVFTNATAFRNARRSMATPLTISAFVWSANCDHNPARICNRRACLGRCAGRLRPARSKPFRTLGGPIADHRGGCRWHARG